MIPLISSDEARQAREAFDAGRPWVKIVEGDRRLTGSNRHGRATGWEFVAPSRWADLDKSCETCQGERETINLTVMQREPCTDCRDGRAIIDFGEFRAPVHVEPNDDARTWTVTLTEVR